MLIRFQRTELVDAPPERMFGVLTAYEAYPRINPFVKTVRVLHRDRRGAKVAADRRTPIERHVQFRDAYAPPPLLQFERRYASHPTARSTWTVEPAFGGRCYFTIAAELAAPGPLGVLLRPVLWRMFHRLNFAPFIQAARARTAAGAAHRPAS
jgi:ribosome-associated toxin RatA of RatAB toxin-antitoxin module